jgi:hypothetical protein
MKINTFLAGAHIRTRLTCRCVCVQEVMGADKKIAAKMAELEEAQRLLEEQVSTHTA